jgi:hypothetical protein
MSSVGVGGHLGQSTADSPAAKTLARSVMSSVDSGARARSVNRTHRVVRERARLMQADRSRMRGLMLPLILCSALMILLYTASWMMVDQYELISEASLDGHRWFMILLWFLPVSAALVAMMWFRRNRNQSDTEAIR